MSDPFNQFNSRFDAMFAPRAVAIGLGVPGTLKRCADNSTFACTLLVERGSQLQGDQSQVLNFATTITSYVADIGEVGPKHGDQFLIGDHTFTVDSLLEKDDDSTFICTVAEFDQ